MPVTSTRTPCGMRAVQHVACDMACAMLSTACGRGANQQPTSNKQQASPRGTHAACSSKCRLPAVTMPSPIATDNPASHLAPPRMTPHAPTERAVACVHQLVSNGTCMVTLKSSVYSRPQRASGGIPSAACHSSNPLRPSPSSSSVSRNCHISTSMDNHSTKRVMCRQRRLSTEEHHPKPSPTSLL